MTLYKQEFQKHIKKINNNDFIYKHKIAFYLLSDRELKLYEAGFKKGFELAQQKMSDHVSEIKETHIVPRQMERKIIGYQFRKPRQTEIDSIINKVCIKYEVSKKELFTKTRTTDIVRSRNIIHNVLSEKYKMSLTEIGKFLALSNSFNSATLIDEKSESVLSLWFSSFLVSKFFAFCLDGTSSIDLTSFCFGCSDSSKRAIKSAFRP